MLPSFTFVLVLLYSRLMSDLLFFGDSALRVFLVQFVSTQPGFGSLEISFLCQRWRSFKLSCCLWLIELPVVLHVNRASPHGIAVQHISKIWCLLLYPFHVILLVLDSSCPPVSWECLILLRNLLSDCFFTVCCFVPCN